MCHVLSHCRTKPRTTVHACLSSSSDLRPPSQYDRTGPAPTYQAHRDDLYTAHRCSVREEIGIKWESKGDSLTVGTEGLSASRHLPSRVRLARLRAKAVKRDNSSLNHSLPLLTITEEFPTP